MKVATVLGARPHFVKAAPLSRRLRERFEEVIIHTGQHYDYEMNRVFFDQLGIPEPDYHLGVGSGTHGKQTGLMLERIEDALLSEMPDVVVVFGDTNTTLAGALAAAKLHIKVAHVEAGLRSFDKTMPEEINRILTDHCSDMLFCPTETAVDNLRDEGITDGVFLTGDVMVDALEQNIGIAEKSSKILDELDINPKEYYLATVHRAENTDEPERLKSIVDSLCEIGNVVLPCHPRTERCLRDGGLWNKIAGHVKVIKPVGYLDMLVLEKNAKKILTDSGGVQKEAYIFRVPCITLRDRTEWVETVEDGWNVLVGADRDEIVKMAGKFEQPLDTHTERFGRADASERITEILER